LARFFKQQQCNEPQELKFWRPNSGTNVAVARLVDGGTPEGRQWRTTGAATACLASSSAHPLVVVIGFFVFQAGHGGGTPSPGAKLTINTGK